MVKPLILIAGAVLAAGACTSTQPAYAAPYVEATSAYNGHDASYGAKAGLQAGNFTLEAGAENFLDGNKPTYVASVGVQPRIAGPFSAYGQASYLNHDGNSGYRLGAGLVADVTEHLYLKGGYQRDDYGQGAHSAATLGLGVKF